MGSYPPPSPPPASRPGMPTWVKVLLVLGGLFVLGILLVGAGLFYFVKKVKDDPGGPVAAVVRMANPGYEVLEVNEKERTLRVRHKKTGKEATIPFEKLQKGSIDPKDVGMTNEEAGVLTGPDWLRYPGAAVQSSAGGARTVQMTLQSDDPVDKVLEYYRGKLREGGFEISELSITKTAMGTHKADKRSVTIQILPVGAEGTTFVVVYKMQ